MYEEFKSQKNYLARGYQVWSLSSFQWVPIIGLASSSSQEANVILSLSWKCLRSFGEVKVQGAIFENGGWWWRCYSGVAGVGIVYVCYLEAFESKRPRNARAKWAMALKLQHLPCFSKEEWFLAMRGFEDQALVFLAQRVLWNMFAMFV